MEAIVNALVLFAAPLLLALFPAWVLWYRPKPRGWRYPAMIGIHAFVCLVLLLLLNGLPGFFPGNADVLAKLHQLPGGVAEVRQPFLLIDNSGNKQLVSDPNGNAEDSTVLVVTDRAKLARLLHRLAAHQQAFAHVVVDIAFTEASPNDSALREAVLDLAEHEKVLVARTVVDNVEPLRFGVKVMADVTERQQENIIAWHRSARDEGHSLPYALYLRLHQRAAERFTLGLWKEDGPDGWRLAYNGFVPTWAYLPKPNTAEGDVALDELPMPIGHALDAGWPRLLRRLEQLGKANAGRKAVIFIGEFPEAPNESSTDRHRTFLGESTGSAMLIDLYHEIENGAHVVKGSSLIGLFIALLLCTWYVFARAWPCRSEAPPTTFAAVVAKRLWDDAKSLGPSLFLYGVAWVLWHWTDQQMNLAPLLVYFLVLMSVVEAVRRLRQKGLPLKCPPKKEAT